MVLSNPSVAHNEVYKACEIERTNVYIVESYYIMKFQIHNVLQATVKYIASSRDPC